MNLSELIDFKIINMCLEVDKMKLKTKRLEIIKFSKKCVLKSALRIKFAYDIISKNHHLKGRI
jgi:hypothetical protein